MESSGSCESRVVEAAAAAAESDWCAEEVTKSDEKGGGAVR